MYLSSGQVGTIYVSHYHRRTGAFRPFQPFATDLGDTEVVAVLEP